MSIFDRQPLNAKSRRGVTLIEAMILLMVLSVLVLGTGTAFQSMVRVPTSNNRMLVTSNLMVDKMESLRALGFTALSTAASGSDSVTVDNVAYSRSWSITTNPGGAYDNNFIQISVTIGTQTFTTGVCKQ